MDEDNKQPCCETWAKAHTEGTDGEAWMPLVRYSVSSDITPHIGCDLPDIAFCPWCGAAKAPNAR